ncbi:MAG: hypothetical protein P8K77_08505 [Polaribacter sp.]|nr:hypothetical protein [Polaribacter sp.]
MKIKELIKLIEFYIKLPIIEFSITKKLFEEDNYRKIFNKIIRNKVENKSGVYVWMDSKTNEIYYIGMAGKINSNGLFGNHSLQKRLIASRGRDKKTKKDIQTNDYVKNFMIENKIESLNFYIMYSKDKEPPAYLEAVLLNGFYKEKNCLPKLNKSF